MGPTDPGGLYSVHRVEWLGSKYVTCLWSAISSRETRIEGRDFLLGLDLCRVKSTLFKNAYQFEIILDVGHTLIEIEVDHVGVEEGTLVQKICDIVGRV